MKHYVALSLLVTMAMGFTTTLALAHSETYQAIVAATIDYVHREHSPDFTPTISCIQLGTGGASAIVNYSAGPKNDPVATTLVLIRPSKLSSSSSNTFMIQSAAPAVDGWATVKATTSPLRPEGHVGAFMLQAFPAKPPPCLQ
jgi:hypothetical protein